MGTAVMSARLAAGVVVLLAVAALDQRAETPASASGAVIVVNTLADTLDPGVCSLRAAIINANHNDQSGSPGCTAGIAGSEDTITFAVFGIITLDEPLPAITDGHGLMVDGGGEITVSGGDESRLFRVENGASVVLQNLTIQDGRAVRGGAIFVHEGGRLTIIDSLVRRSTAEAGVGGGIRNGGDLTLIGSEVIDNAADSHGGGIWNHEDGTLTLTNTRVDDNRTLGAGSFGGGIYNLGVAGLEHSEVTGNIAVSRGGGIYNEGGSLTIAFSRVADNNNASSGGGIGNNGTLTMADSALSGNRASSLGGGLDNWGKATVVRSIISGNTAVGAGGGIFGPSSEVVILNSTVSGNSAEFVGGGGIWTGFGGELSLVNSTVTRNSGGGIYNDGPSPPEEPPALIGIANSIIADQESGQDCAGGGIVSMGHNLGGDGSCDFSEEGDIPDGNANLGSLADHGGPTLTHALLEGSDAIDAGDDPWCKSKGIDGVDQRGYLRPAGKSCDIGAFEFGAMPQGEPRLWGDLDCDGNVAIGDALKTARYLLGLSVSQEPGCPEPGADATADGEPRMWGDVDCDESVLIGDALKIARWLLGLSVSQEEGCPEIGMEVAVG